MLRNIHDDSVGKLYFFWTTIGCLVKIRSHNWNLKPSVLVLLHLELSRKLILVLISKEEVDNFLGIQNSACNISLNRN